MYSKTNDKETN